MAIIDNVMRSRYARCGSISESGTGRGKSRNEGKRIVKAGIESES